jgi:putative DNA primase/helicase
MRARYEEETSGPAAAERSETNRQSDSSPRCFEAALPLVRAKYSVIPIKPGDKHPAIRWKKYQRQIATEDEVRGWFARWPDANLAIVTGEISQVSVHDLDLQRGISFDDFAHLSDVVERTPHGRHLYTAYDPSMKTGAGRSTVGHDTRNDGGYVVVAPSRRADGEYVWEGDAFERLLRRDLPLPASTRTNGHDPTAERVFRRAERLPERIREGQRNDILHSLAGTMRRRGTSEESIRAALRVENRTRCVPPLAETEVDQIAASAMRYESAAREPEHPTDLGNAQRLVRLHGQDLRYVHAYERWLVWDGTRWKIDDTAEAVRRAKATVRAIYTEAGRAEDETTRKQLANHAKASEASSKITAMLTLAKSEPGIPVLSDDLDADPWLLNVDNGTLDLRTGQLRQHDRGDLITKLAPVTYDPNATAPRWEQFLRDIFRGDEELIRFVQLALGYALTGDTSEQVFFVAYGSGSNGKSTLIETIAAMLGEYALQTPTETFMTQSHDSIPNDVARLKGARFVSAIETEEGKRLAVARIKQLTGGDTVAARFMRAEWFEFRPSFKAWLGTNHRPNIPDTTESIWRRILLLPFTAHFTADQRDLTLREKLRAELPGILAWAIKGCLEWQRLRSEGKNLVLVAPHAVSAATAEYRSEQDTLGGFLGEFCVIERQAETSARQLFAAYERWCEQSGERPVSQRTFGTALRERGYSRLKRKGVIVWGGVGLSPDAKDPFLEAA